MSNLPWNEKAIALLEKDGWRQNGFGWDKDCQKCLIGAALIARYGTDFSKISDWLFFSIKADETAKLLGFETRYDAYQWNDDQGRKKEEVIQRLRTARIEEKGNEDAY